MSGNFDPIISTRTNTSNGLMLDKRTDSGNVVFNMYLQGGGSEDGTFRSDHTITLNTAFHFALTHDGSGNFELFIDGVSVGTHATALTLSSIDIGADDWHDDTGRNNLVELCFVCKKYFWFDRSSD